MTLDAFLGFPLQEALQCLRMEGVALPERICISSPSRRGKTDKDGFTARIVKTEPGIVYYSFFMDGQPKGTDHAE